MPDLDLATPQRVHIVGIGGAGMSAIATVLARMGHTVSGSDLKDSRGLERLRVLGVDAFVGHDAGYIGPDIDAVVVSTAIPLGNPEVRAAEARSVPVLRRADALRAIAATRRAIAIAGSHGKTTTSSMLALILRAAGWHPSFVIGGDVNEVGTNAALDDGEWIVVEADESDGTFLELAPEIAVVTNVEPDHLEHYGGFEGLVAGFEQFVAGASATTVLCVDDPGARRLVPIAAQPVTYGFADDSDYRLVHYEGARTGSRFSLVRHGAALGLVELPIPGRHNARNAAGAATVALELGVPFDDIARALGGFGGVARRFQFRGEVAGITLVDDYAHLPSEIAAAIGAAREGGWSRVIAVFQPHRYTRTASLWREFASAFVDADRVVLTDIYAAGEAPQAGVSGRLVLRAVLDAHPSTAVSYLPRRSDLVAHALDHAHAGDVVLTLGAGDVTMLADDWLQAEPS